ncbi:histidine phosphatase family protein [Kineosporia sp. J2-2]|uniref:Histidine phosphatase family protein n=1 Tax=Kineosporia corallincola TaxID=2835133 RepID=A0ABS5TBZ0_9ACTN|nr:histidine phosphatase family protein [Kineosporia corallincola]MBT0768601.1 histidine phosphatase family protein [Kineosporia corallincola]
MHGTEFVFMRHAESRSNLLGTVTSARPGSGLSADGALEARQAGTKSALGQLSAVFSSPLERARKTAEHVRDELPGRTSELAVHTDDRLCEFEVGVLEGRTDHVARQQLWSAWSRWLDQEDLEHRPAERSESGQEAVDRFQDFVRSTAKVRPGERILVVSHGTLLQLALTCLCVNITRNVHDRWISNTGLVQTTYVNDELICPHWEAPRPKVVL